MNTNIWIRNSVDTWVTTCDTKNEGFERNGTYNTNFCRFKVCSTKRVQNSVASTRFQGFCITQNTKKVRLEWVIAEINRFCKQSPAFKNSLQDFVLCLSLLLSSPTWGVLFLTKAPSTKGRAKTILGPFSSLWSPYRTILGEHPSPKSKKTPCERHGFLWFSHILFQS